MSAPPLERRLAKLEGGFGQMNYRLSSIDRRLDGIDRRLDGMETRIEAGFRWLTGLIVTTWVTTIVTLFLHR
jgi:hypothetical protein